jgi:hypothetical protein
MEAIRSQATGTVPGLAEAEAASVWTEQRLRALTRAAFLGTGYDPDDFDALLLMNRAARACAAVARRQTAHQHAPAA